MLKKKQKNKSEIKSVLNLLCTVCDYVTHVTVAVWLTVYMGKRDISV